MTTATARPASDKQRALILKLSAEKLPADQAAAIAASINTLDIRAASALIDGLFQVRAITGLPDAAPLDPGMYRMADGTICKVQKSKESGKSYAKKLVAIRGNRLSEADENIVHWEFQYEAGLIRRLDATMRLSLDDAKAFGIRYGVCCVCGRLLKDATSVANGIGPICAGRL